MYNRSVEVRKFYFSKENGSQKILSLTVTSQFYASMRFGARTMGSGRRLIAFRTGRYLLVGGGFDVGVARVVRIGTKPDSSRT